MNEDIHDGVHYMCSNRTRRVLDKVEEAICCRCYEHDDCGDEVLGKYEDIMKEAKEENEIVKRQKNPELYIKND